MNKLVMQQAALRHPSAVLHPYDALMGLEGFDVLYALCENFGGATVYVPTARRMFAECMAKQAACEFNGYNYDVLARKYGYSRRQMRRLIMGTQ